MSWDSYLVCRAARTAATLSRVFRYNHGCLSVRHHASIMELEKVTSRSASTRLSKPDTMSPSALELMFSTPASATRVGDVARMRAPWARSVAARRTRRRHWDRPRAGRDREADGHKFVVIGCGWQPWPDRGPSTPGESTVTVDGLRAECRPAVDCGKSIEFSNEEVQNALAISTAGSRSTV